MAAQLGEALLLLVSLVLQSNATVNTTDLDHFVLFYFASVIAAGVPLALMVEIGYAMLKLCRGKRAAEESDVNCFFFAQPSVARIGPMEQELQLSILATASLQRQSHSAEDDEL